MPNYTEKNSPCWISSDAFPVNRTVDSTLTVASFNIQFSLKLEEALTELNTYPFCNADIILLQEMDEEGTMFLSNQLHYNYLYFPISYNIKHDKNFGNAILSKWPIKSPEKKMLPHFQPLSKQKRGVTSAVIEYGNLNIKAYSIHLETPVLSRSKRMAQLQRAIENVPDDDHEELVIAGGDFNSLYPRDVTQMVDLCQSYNLEWNTKNVGHTLNRFNVIRPTLDHIFSKGFTSIDAGKIKSSVASDHSPIWATLKIN